MHSQLMRLLLVVSLLASCAKEKTPARPLGTLFVLGDSITAGEGVSPSENFVQLIASQHVDWDVRSEGAPGWSIADYLAHAAEVVRDLPESATLVVIALGTNDCLTQEPDDAMAARAQRQMGELAQRIQGALPKARLAIVAPAPVNAVTLSPRLRNAGFGENSAVRLQKLGGALQELARQKGYGFVSLSDLIRAPNLPDGVHPDAAGHRQIAQAVGALLVAR